MSNRGQPENGFPSQCCRRPLFTSLALALAIAVNFSAATPVLAFSVDTSPPPPTHHPIAPADDARVRQNPPSMVWREDKSAASYILELSRDSNFAAGGQTIRTDGITFPFYNHNRTLAVGKWFWRYYVVRKDGAVSSPGPVRSFEIPPNAVPLPVPTAEEILTLMPAHPRIFVTPQTLTAFQEKRNNEGKAAWESIRINADRALEAPIALKGTQVPLSQARIVHNADSQSSTWKQGQPVRRQVFYKNDEGQLFWLPQNTIRDLNRAAERLDTLSLAWQISEEPRYLDAALDLIELLAPLRLDAHLADNERAEHDSVVYAYENGLKALALAYDRLYHELTQAQRQAVIAHVEFHADAAGQWLKKNTIHTTYQISHPQQCMHALLVTVLATAKSSEKIDQWVRYLVPQYMNRIAWTSEDGGYFEGQTYGHKFAWILEGLAAIRSATGVDLFKKAEVRNSGDFWLYAMNLNYWFQHWGDNYNLILQHANPRDAYITAFLAAMNNDPYVKWYSETILTNPEASPFDYLSAGPLRQRPPVDIAQARLFAPTGVVTAYNALYDHSSERIFFRSSPWGSHSHAHADQNGFIIHAGGEILAPDTGYYTYYGDAYDMKWNKATFAHNSMLVNGNPQGRGISAKGRIDGFFHSAWQAVFTGNASHAYGDQLNTFYRTVLYIRPSTYVVYDELKAPAPAKYSWLLNVFQEPQIDPQTRSMTIGQQHMRMRVDTLLPEKITYSANNDRPYPIKDPERPSSRYTEAFPQPWHIRVENQTPADRESFLTLMRTWDERQPQAAATQSAIQNENTVGAKFKNAHTTGVVLFRRNQRNSSPGSGASNDQRNSQHDGQNNGQHNNQRNSPLDAGGIHAKAQSVCVLRSTQGALQNWLVYSGSHLGENGERLFSSESPIHASADFTTPAAAALLHVEGRSRQIAVRLRQKPEQVFIAPPSRPEQAQPLAFTWDEVASSIVFAHNDNAAAAIWVNPVSDLRQPLPAGEIAFTDSRGTYTVALQPAWTERGEIMYFAEVMPREIGNYTIRPNDADANGTGSLFVQDRWDPYSRSSRGTGALTGEVRDGSWLYLKTAPGSSPQFTATLDARIAKGAIDNILFNGDFEFGIPNYPPRGWTLSLERGQSRSWYSWSQADATSGNSSVHYVRDSKRYQLRSRPMRLLKEGNYHLRFQARGSISNASITVSGSQYSSVKVDIAPSAQWRSYEAQVRLPAGYTLLTIVTPDGPKGEELWVDAIEFGLIPNP